MCRKNEALVLTLSVVAKHGFEVYSDVSLTKRAEQFSVRTSFHSLGNFVEAKFFLEQDQSRQHSHVYISYCVHLPFYFEMISLEQQLEAVVSPPR
jgi:hypothetical protein